MTCFRIRNRPGFHLFTSLTLLLFGLSSFGVDSTPHRVIVSTDIGGTDPDDYQSMVHLLIHADVLDLEGLISSPYGPGRKKHILEVIDLYEQDYSKLRSYSEAYPTPDELRSITMQGETEVAPYVGFRRPTDGSRHIENCARRDDPRPLNILVWGGLEDLAQALHDAPDILPKLRVYFIGGPNKKWSPDAYQYIVTQHPTLQIIEANSTYRGWFVGGNQDDDLGNQSFVSAHIKGHGALGDFFATKLGSTIKMGDSPSVGWLLNGNPADPSQPGWGGQFVRAWERSHVVFNRLTTKDDLIEVFGVFELVLPLDSSGVDAPEATMLIENQSLKGFIDKKGSVRFRFSPKAAKPYHYTIQSNTSALDGLTGNLTAIPISPEVVHRPDPTRPNWWTDDPSPALSNPPHDGTKTVNRWREDFLNDFANHMIRCAVPADESESTASGKPRVIVTSDGEIDDECSMVRFLLYANEWDIEGIITSSSQYHWQGHKWAGDDWIQPYLEAYRKVYTNLVKHDSRYPTPAYLQARTFLGNVKAEGEMDERTPGSEHIVKVLLDASDNRPVWLQAWGGTNTIARALKTIEEEHPEKMAYVANKIRFFFIWEQDSTYQSYIRPKWGKYDILTIISDQFIAIAYHLKKLIPAEKQARFAGDWMKENILHNHGPLCDLYKAHVERDKGYTEGDFRSEGDSPAFLHTVVTGLRNLESPDWGGWGGRYVRVRENTWLDPVPVPDYQYPEGRWYTASAWGRERLRANIQDDNMLTTYLKPIWRWTDAIQNDFASRADWCVKSFQEANHPPVVALGHPENLNARRGTRITLSAKGTADPDGDALAFRWWHYQEAGSYKGSIELKNAQRQESSFLVPVDAGKGKSIHIICEVTDTGTPRLTRYQRVIVEVD